MTRFLLNEDGRKESNDTLLSGSMHPFQGRSHGPACAAANANLAIVEAEPGHVLGGRGERPGEPPLLAFPGDAVELRPEPVPCAG